MSALAHTQHSHCTRPGTEYDTGPVKILFHRLFPRKCGRGPHDEAVPVPDDVEIWVVTGSFRARPGAEDQLIAVLAKYVVLTRMRPHCRNVDLMVSATDSGRLLVVEKWADGDAPRAHLDEDETVDMARAAVPLLADNPDLHLYETISAHDLA
jgi:quinol monooxygenase YgiN